MGDRSGGREPKGASLKKSKKNPGASAARIKKPAKNNSINSPYSLAPPLLIDSVSTGKYFDCSVAILSRQFDRDRDRIYERSKDPGRCVGIMVWFSDIEKQSQLFENICKIHPGFCYYATGIHPDNIDRTNKKSHNDWLERIEELGHKSECIALLSGLNLNRETGTHFAQESLLKSSLILSEKLLLPMILHIPDSRSLQRTIEILTEFNWIPTNDDSEGKSIIIHDVMMACSSNEHILTSAIEMGMYFVVTATGFIDQIDQSKPINENILKCLQLIPHNKLLVATDSPWKTPQCIDDPYLRTLRNEPSNISFIVMGLSTVLGMTVTELSDTILRNTLELFGLEFHSPSTETKKEEAIVLNTDSVFNTYIVDNSSTANELRHVLNQSCGLIDLKEVQQGISDLEIQLVEEDDEKELKDSNYYGCIKCRNQLFSIQDILSHHDQPDPNHENVMKSVFKMSERGLCNTNIHISVDSIRIVNRKVKGGSETTEKKKKSKENPHDGMDSLGYEGTGLSFNLFNGSAIECIHCGSKLGKYYAVDTVCACGVSVAGPVMKLLATKIDYIDKITATHILANRVCQEAEQYLLEMNEDNDEAIKKASKIKKGKKIKSENRGNFSSFRNKSFIPNASRVNKKGSGGVEETDHANGVNDEELENDDEDDNEEDAN